MSSITVKKQWEIILQVKDAFLMFCVISNERVEKHQKSNKSMRKETNAILSVN